MTECASIADLLEPPGHEQTIRHAHGRGRDLKQSEIDRFLARGINALDLANPWPVAADRVVFQGEFFQFADDAGVEGVAAFTFVVIGTSGFTDLAAWDPTTNSIAVWTGDGFALGEGQICCPGLTAGVAIHRTPIGWLKTGRRGIVIARRSFASEILGALPALVAEDEQHANDLRTLFFSGSTMPKIAIADAPTCKRVPA